MSSKRDVDKQLDELVSINVSGDGFGCPEAAAEHDRKIQFLMHRQMQQVNKSNSYMSVANVVIAIINVGILIYQVFYR